MKRLLVPGIPFALSLALSLSCVGSTVGWQDSGFFLAGVKDLGVLYPPGFVLYLLLCKAWTLLLGWLDFTLAVHLFSSFCAALAAGTLALASRDLLRTRGPLFRVSVDAAVWPDGAAIAAGCLAAGGFTFWSAALLAKGYALLYLVLSLLLWRLLRADESGSRRDFTTVAVLIGLAWAAHPSAVGVGLALALFVAASRSRLDGKGIALRSALAAAVAIAPSLLLPVLAAREPSLKFGDPVGAGDWFRYLRGARFTGMSGAFGVDAFRVLNVFRYLWEELLGVGVLLTVAGLVRIVRVNRPLAIGIAAWVIPSALLATLFRIEGQQDFWLLSSWLPFVPVAALGADVLASRFGRWAIPAAGALGLAWGVIANGPAVSMRGDTLAEAYGRFHLEPLERGAILALESDDALSTTRYLQIVRGLRPDVLVIEAGRFRDGDWYPRHLLRRDPTLRPAATLVDFALANGGRPWYFESPPEDPRLALLPAGPLSRWASDGEPQDWPLPLRLEDVRSRYGRPRGIRLQALPGGLEVLPEPYEKRWVTAAVRAQSQLGQHWFGRGRYDRAAEAYEAARAADPDAPPGYAILRPLSASYFLLKRYDRAEPLLKQVLRLQPPPRVWVQTNYFLSEICRSQGRFEESRRYHEQAMAVASTDPELRRELEAPR